MNNLDIRVTFNGVDDREKLISGKAKWAIQQSNEFGNDVICGDDGMVCGAGMAQSL